MEYLNQIYSLYHLPIWLTGFACGDHSALRPLADEMKFMKEIIPRLEAAHFVFRYAWMSARQGSTTDNRGLLGPAGSATLTALGQLYNTL